MLMKIRITCITSGKRQGEPNITVARVIGVLAFPINTALTSVLVKWFFRVDVFARPKVPLHARTIKPPGVLNHGAVGCRELKICRSARILIVEYSIF